MIQLALVHDAPPLSSIVAVRNISLRLLAPGDAADDSSVTSRARLRRVNESRVQRFWARAQLAPGSDDVTYATQLSADRVDRLLLVCIWV
jgi:hypothetical protein